MPSVCRCVAWRSTQASAPPSRTAADPWWVPLEPVVRRRLGAASRPRRVKICTTPPIASAPYRLERGPRTISIRSIVSRGRSCSAGVPFVTEPMRTPSTSQSVWSDSAPRTNTEVTLPRPPPPAMAMPSTPASSSSTVRACVRSMSARWMTVTEDSAASSGCGRRAAVTTTTWADSPAPARVDCAWIGAAMNTIKPAANAARRTTDTLSLLSPPPVGVTGSSGCGESESREAREPRAADAKRDG